MGSADGSDKQGYQSFMPHVKNMSDQDAWKNAYASQYVAYQQGHSQQNMSNSEMLEQRNKWVHMYGGPKHLSSNATKASEEMRDAYVKKYAGEWSQYMKANNQQYSQTNNQQSQASASQATASADAAQQEAPKDDSSAKDAAALSALPQWWTSAPSEAASALLVRPSSPNVEHPALAAAAGGRAPDSEVREAAAETKLRGASNLASKPESKSFVPFFATLALIVGMVAAFAGRSYLRQLGGTKPEMEQYAFLQA